MPPTIIFGDVRDLDVVEIKAILHEYDVKNLDTAAGYMAGESERRLGEARMGDTFSLDSKILTGRPLEGTLEPEKIEASSKGSLERLRVNKLRVLYCHAPDPATPIEVQAKGFDDVFQKGRFSELGVSNFKLSMVQEWLKIACKKGYVKPSWYQGHYNLLARGYEEDMFPTLRKEGFHFAAYSPLGGGFLNGNLTPSQTKGSRFTTHEAKHMYKGHFDQPAMHAAFEKLQTLSDKTGLGTDELALRWLMHHSFLKEGDAVIVGASKAHQIETSLANLRKGPLPEDVVGELNGLYDSDVRAVAREIAEAPLRGM